MDITLDDLVALGFTTSHSIRLAATGLPTFVPVAGEAPPKTPSVYLWVAQSKSTRLCDVLYVGKAGKGVTIRCGQHQNGFTTSGTGKKNAAAIAEVLRDSDRTVLVLAREAARVELFGKRVSLYAAEEDALCARFRPWFNRTPFPDVGAAEGLAGDVSQRSTGDSASAGIPDLINRRFRDQDEGTLDDLMAQLQSYDEADRSLLRRTLEFVETRIAGPDHSSKLVGGYTGQIKGCDGVTALAYGRLLRSGSFAKESWVARIFLAKSPRLALPLRLLRPGAASLAEATKDSFAPLDLEDLFRAPDRYLQDPITE
jgi:hypothetical protein